MAKSKRTVTVELPYHDLNRAFLDAEEKARDICIEPDDGHNPYDIDLELVRTTMKSTRHGSEKVFEFEFSVECDWEL